MNVTNNSNPLIESPGDRVIIYCRICRTSNDLIGGNDITPDTTFARISLRLFFTN
jgi:hypothetical protein